MATAPTISTQSVCGLKQNYEQLISPVLLSGLAGKDTTAKFQCVAGLSLNVSDSFLKNN